MNWTSEDKDAIVNNAMDLCANVDSFRQVVIITMGDNGILNVVELKKPGASEFELLGIYKIVATEVQEGLMMCAMESKRPMNSEDME